MGDDITLLLVLEARDKAAAIIEGITGKVKGYTDATKVAADQATRSAADIAAANEKATATTASYERAVKAQTDAQASLREAMLATKSAQLEADAAVREGAANASAAAKLVTEAATQEEAALVRLQEAERLAGVRAKDMSAAQAAASTEAEASSSKMTGLGVAAGATALAVGYIGVKSIEAAADFQTSTTRLMTSAGETSKTIDTVRQGILKMAGDVGYSTSQLSDAMYKVSSGTFTGAAGLEVLRAAAEGAKTENADLKTVADAVTTTLIDYHLGADQAAMVATKLVAATSAGKTTFEELAASLHSVMPLASMLHVPLSDILGDLAAITLHGQTADQATQNLADTLKHMQTVTPTMAKELAVLGMTSNQLADDLRTKGLSGTLQEISDRIQHFVMPGTDKVILDLRTALNGLSPAVRDLGMHLFDGSMTAKEYAQAAQAMDPISAKQAMSFATLAGSMHRIGDQQMTGAQVMQNYGTALYKATGDATALNMALMLSGDNAKTANTAIKTVTDATTEAGNHVKGWSEIQGTFNQKMAQAKGSLEAAKIAIGTGLLPAVTAIASEVVKVITPIASWMAKHQALSAIILGSLGVLALLVGAIWAINAAMGALAANPVVAIIVGIVAALALLTAGVMYAWNHWGWFRTAVLDTWNAIKVAALWTWNNVLKPTFDGIRIAIMQGVVPAALWLWHNALEPAFKGIAAVATWLWNNVLKPSFEGWVILFRNVIGPVVMWLWHNVVEPAWKGIQIAIQVAWTILQPVFAVIGAVLRLLGDAFTWLWRDIIKPVWQGIQLEISIAWAIIQVIWGLIQIAIKSLAEYFTWLWHGVQDVWKGIQVAIQEAWNLIKPYWDAMVEVIKVFIVPAFQWLWQQIQNVWNGISSTISSFWNDRIKPVFTMLAHFITDEVEPAFRAGVDAVGKAWQSLEDAAKVPVKFVVNTVLNDGLLAAYNWVAKTFGVKPDNVHISLPAGFAEGGQIPGTPSSVDNMLAMVATGEYIMPTHRTRQYLPMLEAMRAGVLPKYPGDLSGFGVKGYAGGGLVGALSSLGSKVWDLFTDPVKVLAGPVNAVINSIPGGGTFRDLLVGGGHKLLDGLIAWVKGAGGSGNAGSAMAFLKAQAGKPYIWDSAGPAGYDCCIVAGVRIYGPDGAKSIEDVRAGDRVFSYVDGRLEVHTVTAAWQSKYQPVFAVRTRNRTVTASANHPFLRLTEVSARTEHRDDADWPGPVRMAYGSRKGARCSLSTCDEPVLASGMCATHRARWRQHGDPRIHFTTALTYGTEWARLDELKRGDLLVQPRAMPSDAKPHPVLSDGTPVDPDVAWLVGASVGDGTVTDKGLRLCLFGEMRDRATRIITERWGSHPTHGASYGLVVSSRRLCDSLTALGMRVLGPDKRIPEAVWTWAADLQRAFLDGYCDADGHRPANQSKHGERTYSSASEDLIEDVRALHIMLGDAVSNVHVTKRTKPITIQGKLVKNARTQYGVTIWPDARYGEAKMRIRPGLAAWLDAGDFTLAPVLAVDPKGEADTWDLNIEGSHNFVADGVVVHNSGIVSAVFNVLHGRNPYSHTFSTSNEAPFFPLPGLGGLLSAGWTNPGEPGPGGNNVGHTAGVLAGVPFESTGSQGVHIGAGVTPIGAFAHVGHFDSGGPLYPGWTAAYNGTGRTEWVSPNGPGGAGVYIDLRESKFMSDKDIDDLIDKLDKRLARTLVPAAGIQVRR